ncbi:MAG: BolA family transcriptional regulator [Gammaproteobacteria bacterium]|nr:BolA family transcriptional regulator [Gammaproteobacteria bacterium]
MTTADTRMARIEAALSAALAPHSLSLVDESHLHRGHAGAASGRGHFRVHVVSTVFAGKAPLARHRLVYSALGPLMETDIHALSIEALSPDEATA